MILDPHAFRHHIDTFNADDAAEDVVQLVPNAQCWDWMLDNVPWLDCPDAHIERAWYYRWWCYRKHLKSTPAGTIVTEFILPVRHAGLHNSISCALGHHLAEGRWIRDRRYLDEYTRFWFVADDGKPEPRFHRYSSWLASACWDRFCVTSDRAQLVGLLDHLVEDDHRWDAEKRRPDGLYFQYDVWDGMEESISGSRTHKNARPTINSYMTANARAIARIARLADRSELAAEYQLKAESLRRRFIDALWDPQACFFKAQTNEGPLSDAREAIGFVPFVFNLPDSDRGYERAYDQLIDPDGFWAPHGLTTAERRHPRFRSHGVGKCEWDGAVWPFATSQTLMGLANVLRFFPATRATRSHFAEAMTIYARSHQREGRAYLGEYHCERTGEWLKGDNPRSRFYNHSTFCDLVITGLVGLMPQGDGSIIIDPLMPADRWNYFCLDRVPYHGWLLTIVWDRDGTRYGRGAGLSVWSGDARLAHSPRLATLYATALVG